jgi:type IV pilus assembly protein PilV
MNRTQSACHAQRGFSLIEVLIALVVLAFGLLGLALLQTVNLKYTQSANQRTQAVNLAGELLDMMRSNRSEVSAYYMPDGSLSGVDVAANGCPMPNPVGAAANVTRWRCEVREALGPDASVAVGPDAADPDQVTVTVRWVEAGSVVANDQGEITVSSRL